MIYPIARAELISGGKALRHYGIDNPENLLELPGLEKCRPGSDAYCVTTGDVYILSSAGVWEVQ